MFQALSHNSDSSSYPRLYIFLTKTHSWALLNSYLIPKREMGLVSVDLSQDSNPGLEPKFSAHPAFSKRVKSEYQKLASWLGFMLFPAQQWKSDSILSWGFHLDELNRAMTQGESSTPFVGSVLWKSLKRQEIDWVSYGPMSQNQQKRTWLQLQLWVSNTTL